MSEKKYYQMTPAERWRYINLAERDANYGAEWDTNIDRGDTGSVEYEEEGPSRGGTNPQNPIIVQICHEGPFVTITVEPQYEWTLMKQGHKIVEDGNLEFKFEILNPYNCLWREEDKQLT